MPTDALGAPSSRPLVSFVLVVHREQAYLEQCTTSLLDARAGEDVELVAIDDASPDHVPELLDALAASDERVRVLHNERREGIGAGRNAALELVRGEYVWFVETTDVLPAGALPSVAAALSATRPDLLLVDHARQTPLGSPRPGPRRALLRRMEERGPGPLDVHPGAAGAAPRAWDKLRRAGALGALGVRFGDGGHGELSVTWPALLAAESIAALADTTYLRRRPANAAKDTSAGGSARDALARYEDALGWAERSAVPDERRRLLLPAVLDHALALQEELGGAERRAFVHGLSELVERHARGDEPRPAGRIRGLRSSLAGADRPRALGLLEEALAARGAVARRGASAARLRRRVTARVRSERMARHYRARRRAPIDEQLAVYAAYWYRGYSCNPRAIYEKQRELAPDVRGVWVVKAKSAGEMPAGVEHVVAGTRECQDVLARGHWFVNNVNWPNDFVKRPGTKHVMTHHGTPLKYMGLDLRDSPVTAARMDFDALLRRCRRWDYSISSNPFSTLVWERVFPVPFESLEYGYPRNDALVAAGDDDVARIRAELGIAPGQRAVLYAPTHREYRAGYSPVLDVAKVADALGPDHVVLARLHYFYGADPHLQALHAAGMVRDVADHPSIEELCLAADVLVTDFSSLMFDYAVLDRPIVIHAPDWEVYKATRGAYFDLLAEGPGPVTRDEQELVATVRDAEPAPDPRRTAFRERFCSLEDGHAAERVVRRVFLGERVPAPAPPATVA
jgi:CDP-glycerol glycerophosphotransferase